MKYELIIAEKPNAALKIAEALADKKTVKKSVGKISYYELEHKGKRIVVGCAVGHLFGLVEDKKILSNIGARMYFYTGKKPGKMRNYSRNQINPFRIEKMSYPM